MISHAIQYYIFNVIISVIGLDTEMEPLERTETHSGIQMGLDLIVVISDQVNGLIPIQGLFSTTIRLLH